MAAVYKVRMLVLDLVTADSPEEAQDEARAAMEENGYTVLQVEEPDVAPPAPTYGSLEGDIYP